MYVRSFWWSGGRLLVGVDRNIIWACHHGASKIEGVTKKQRFLVGGDNAPIHGSFGDARQIHTELDVLVIVADEIMRLEAADLGSTILDGALKEI
jgi:hypothetical protein